MDFHSRVLFQPENVKMQFFIPWLIWMGEINKIIEDAWNHQDNPELLLKKFQEVFEYYSGNPVYLFEYANALDFSRPEQSNAQK